LNSVDFYVTSTHKGDIAQRNYLTWDGSKCVVSAIDHRTR